MTDIPRAYSSYLAEFDKRDVHRAAATFWVCERDDLQTSIEFLNYWKIKRHIDACTLLVTLRDTLGVLVAQDTKSLTTASGISIVVRDLLGRTQRSLPFEGSVEVEILAETPMGFAYPAMLALYEGHDWQALVHTYARTYGAMSGDSPELMTGLFRAVESNWTIRDSAAYQSFLVIHNGAYFLPPDEMKLEAFNAAGDLLRVSVPLAAIPPYATTRVVPSHFADVASFLAGRPGWMIASFTTRGAFPRLLAGHARITDGALFSLTHSHHDSRSSTEWMSPEKLVAKPMFLSVARRTPWRTRVIGYPTHPANEYAIKQIDYNTDGEPVKTTVIERLHSDVGITDMRSFDADLPPTNSCAISDIVLDAPDSRWPTRFHLGVEFTSEHEMPACFTTGFASFRKPRYSTWWLPLLNLIGREDRFVLLNTDIQEIAPSCRLEARLYRQSDEETLQTDVVVPSNSSVVGTAQSLIAGAERFLSQERGWLVFRCSERANLHVYYATTDLQSGCIAADHAF